MIKDCKSSGVPYNYSMLSNHNWVDFSGRHVAPGGSVNRMHHHPGLDWMAPLAETNEMMATPQEALLIGRADQHRLGEMLMPHVLGRLLHFSKIRCAGLVSADFTDCGGHVVRSYGECAKEMRGAGLRLVHFGGDALALDLVEGYREAAGEEEAECFEGLVGISGRAELLRYLRRRTGQGSEFAYVLDSAEEFAGCVSGFHAVGLSEPWRLGAAAKERLVGILRRAQFVGVRDRNGAEFLEGEGVRVERMPCALTVLPQVCARPLREARDRESLESVRRRFPNGWIAVETGGVRERDAGRLAAALQEVSERTGLGMVFFEANGLAGGGRRRLRRWVEAFPEWQAMEFGSVNLWETASLLLHSRLYCGSDLGARTICMSGGVGRIHVPTGTAETRSYCDLWEHGDVPVEFAEDGDWSEALVGALAVGFPLLQKHSAWLHARYQESLDRFCRSTGIEARLVAATDHERAARRRREFQEGWLEEVAGSRRKGGVVVRSF